MSGPDIKPFQPERDYQAGEITSYWHGTGGWISVVKHAADDDDEAYSVILSRVTFELVNQYGLEATQRILRKFADHAWKLRDTFEGED